MKTSRSMVLTFVLLMTAPVLAQGPDWVAMEKRWQLATSDTGNAGIAYAVVKDGKVVRMGGIGKVAPHSNRNVMPQTLFYLASVTKPFVALSLVELVRAKRIDLDAPVVRYLPQFDLADHEYARQVTIRDLMSHRAGLHSEYITTVAAYLGRLDDASFFAALRQVSPTKQFRYSNLNYLILERVVERITGKPWASSVEQYVLKPLRMKTTTADVAALHSPNAAQPLEWNGTDASIAPAQKTQSTMNAAGGLISSASDLAKLLQELTGSRGHVITEDISRQLFAKEAEVKKGIAFIQRNAYGLGWYIGGLEGRPLIHHFGSFVGAHVHLSFSPEDHIGVAVLANEDTPMVHAIAADIYSLLRTGKPDNKVEAIQAMALRFAEKMKQQAAAKPKAEPMSADWAGRYENPVFGEAEITPEGMLTVGCVHAPMQIQASGFAVVLGDDHLAGAVHLDRDEPRLELVVEGRSLEFVRQRRR